MMEILKYTIPNNPCRIFNSWLSMSNTNLVSVLTKSHLLYFAVLHLIPLSQHIINLDVVDVAGA